jgi:hypothetical protein
VPRSLADTEPFFAGLKLVEPGLVPMVTWRPDPGSGQDPRSVYASGGIAANPRPVRGALAGLLRRMAGCDFCYWYDMR